MFRLSIVFLFVAEVAMAQNPNPPCGDDYGNSTDEDNIILQMRYGSIVEAVNAINQAKNTRGYALGCPQLSYNYNTGNYSQPLLSDVENIWNTVHKPAIEAFTINCPRIGRYENNAALGAYYANLAGYPSNLNVLKDIGDMQIAQQYSSSNVAVVDPAHEGVFAYIHVGSLNSCYPGGVVGSTVDLVCANIPSYCVDFDYGLFAGENFLIGDQHDPSQLWDGGIAYDHGWIGAHLIEAAIQQTDATTKGIFKNSVTLAGEWAVNQEVVKNHNYTSKLIWLLAQMYLWTGDDYYKNELNYKLDKNLLPSVLMDTNAPDTVDGTNPPIAFDDLTTIAQVPGRSWDGHNSLPWYSAMNTWALVESYVAFRDRGDTVRAAELKPYAVAMLDNLSWEINNLGVIDDQLGIRDLTYSLLIGIWKIAQYENEVHPDWESAAWAMWNSGYFNTYSTHSVCVGLYLIVLTDTPYVPLFDREEYGNITEVVPSNKVLLYPNPASEKVNISFDNFDHQEMTIQISDVTGRRVYSQTMSGSSLQLDVSSWRAGTYICVIRDQESGSILTQRFVLD